MANKLMFNPFKSLFGKIFLWFWLTTLVMVLGAIWLSRQLGEETKYLPAAPDELHQARRFAEKLNDSALVRRFNDPQQFLETLGARQRLALILLDPKSGELLTGFPGGQRMDAEPFLALAQQDSPLRIDNLFGHFIGPLEVTLDQHSYLLFVGRPKPPGFIPQTREHPWLVLSLFLGISGLFCLALTWSIVRPIRQLREAAQEMAQGHLQTRADNVAKRNDEVGELGREFNHMAAQLQQMLEGQKRMLADISHELRSPLARLQLALGIAQEKTPNVKTELDRIELESVRIDKMLASLLTLARLDAGKGGLRPRSMSLEELLEPLCEDLRFEAQAQNKSFAAEYPENVQLSVDAELICGALENVMRNALKYAQQRVILSAEVHQGFLHLHIADDGPGVPEDELDKILIPFYRVSSARSRDTGGTGLGLAIANRAVLAHGGSMMARNGSMGGLEVTISLKII
ncbi:HAMP domain-containing protein [Aliiglaciecola sp. CAU 1673]|uniref:ATP-binding protein n=1 Tax=Aliiglaciecola sp. CAU 1673 TaxID=3032595 RepID=UPI0023D9E8ED|nr:ATP-binding protein [Aliiglaciecola sp. CAU 1673]MDF2178695.1 HAMP domain-containing protein [Aliiglaciecola sp. CAU 1673]